jgi:hypothetical protein
MLMLYFLVHCIYFIACKSSICLKEKLTKIILLIIVFVIQESSILPDLKI